MMHASLTVASESKLIATGSMHPTTACLHSVAAVASEA